MSPLACQQLKIQINWHASFFVQCNTTYTLVPIVYHPLRILPPFVAIPTFQTVQPSYGLSGHTFDHPQPVPVHTVRPASTIKLSYKYCMII
eukprot:COSAG05_NODE_186_length_14726_cov_28.333630_10_plen_91_part_00